MAEAVAASILSDLPIAIVRSLLLARKRNRNLVLLDDYTDAISSYARKTCDLWIVDVSCSVMSMQIIRSESSDTRDQFPHTTRKLQAALVCQQLETVIQLGYDISIEENYVLLLIGIDNVRCDVSPLESVPDLLKSDLLSTERYFPSRISFSIVPQLQEIKKEELTISVDQSSASTLSTRQISTALGIGASIQAPKSVGLSGSATTTSTINMDTWKFHPSVKDTNGIFEWILYDNRSGSEVYSSSPPSNSTFWDVKPWYKHRYSKSYSPFTKQGGVTFSGDQYGATFKWRLPKKMEGNTFNCEIRGTICLTYWPNTYNTSFYETRSLDFNEAIEFPLVQSKSLPSK
eukprot:Gb_31240 [translate_table: standard]